MTPQKYKAEREKRGTQEAVAKMLSVGRVTIAKRETNGPITREAWLALCSLPPLKSIRSGRVVPAFKKYILFQHDSCYPAGGLGDIKGSFNSLSEAQAAAQKDHMDYNEVVDRDTWKEVWSD